MCTQQSLLTFPERRLTCICSTIPCKDSNLGVCLQHVCQRGMRGYAAARTSSWDTCVRCTHVLGAPKYWGRLERVTAPLLSPSP